jgi:FeS assembly SUF system protein
MTDTAQIETGEAKAAEVKTSEVKTANMETQSALPPEETERLGGEIVAALKTVFDPEIPADIYELGLIYKVDIKDDRAVDVMMTLTTPNCPAAGELPTMVENAVASVPGVGVVNVKLVWEPAWSPGLTGSRQDRAEITRARDNRH